MKMDRIIICIMLVVVFIAMMVFPAPRKPFHEIYQHVKPQLSKSLQDFRKKYPLEPIDVSGVQWTYLTAGRGTKTILFLHGMAGAADIWWQQMNRLESQYRMIAVTYPPVPSLDGLARGIDAILQKENVKKFYLIGTSLGGYLAQYLVLNHPERIEKAIFANTFPPNTIIAEKNRVAGKILPYLPEWAVLAMLRKNTEKKLYPASGNSELVRAYMREQSYGMMSKSQFLNRFYCVIDPFAPPDLKRAGVPVLLLEADNDPLVEPALRRLLKKTYPSASVETLHDTGHFSYLNVPENYTKILRDFFD